MNDITINMFYRISSDENDRIYYDIKQQIDFSLESILDIGRNIGSLISNNILNKIEQFSIFSNSDDIESLSISMRAGNCRYIILLNDGIGCQFGPKSSPLSLFAPDYFQKFITNMALYKLDGTKIDNFYQMENDDLSEYPILIFEFDRENAIASLKADRSKVEEHGKHIPHENENEFIIPFYYNLYDKETMLPVWIFNDHSIINDDHDHDHRFFKNPSWHGKVHPKDNSAKFLWHGKVHPRSSSFLIV